MVKRDDGGWLGSGGVASPLQNSATLSCKLLCKIFIVSVCGVNLSLNLFYLGLNYVFATFVTAATNTIPAMLNVVSYKTRPNAKDFIQVEVIVEKNSQKVILIGKFKKGRP